MKKLTDAAIAEIVDVAYVKKAEFDKACVEEQKACAMLLEAGTKRREAELSLRLLASFLQEYNAGVLKDGATWAMHLGLETPLVKLETKMSITQG